jgi:NADH-quinone oxidoreductase subunit G
LQRVRSLLETSGRQDASSVRFVVSAHASLEELFLVRQLAVALKGDRGPEHVHVTWRHSPKPQSDGTTFRVSAIDAPNVAGARALGLVGAASDGGPGDLLSLRGAIERGTVSVVYVLDPGPDGSLGDVAWLIEARRSGRLPALVYQGSVSTALAAVADVVLPGAAWVEKDACYANDTGRVQAASRAIKPPGEAVEDWQIVAGLAAALGLEWSYASAKDIRRDLTAALSGVPGYDRLAEIEFTRPVSARHWLQASNPMERWKWSVMFQDLPPVKGHNVQMEAEPASTVIPLQVVK